MYNEASDVGRGGGLRAARHMGFQAPLNINLSKQVLYCNLFPLRFVPPAPLLLLLLLSLTRCNFVVSSVPAGCDNPLLLIIPNQGGLSLSLPPSPSLSPFLCPFSLCRRQTKWRRMKHVRNLFKDRSEDGLSG